MDLGSYSFTNEDHEKAGAASSLSWRADQKESLSDWTIIVNQTDKYHVHKCFMGVGPRSSRYFARLFASNMTETKSSTSHLELQDTAAKAFPEMLDFMYGSTHPIRATTETAVALRSLSNYLGIPSLWDTVTKEFIEGDLKILNAPLYLQEATKYQDDAMIKAATKTCVYQFCHLQNYPKALALFPPDLFQNIVKQRFENPEKLGIFSNSCSTCLSVCVANYCQHTKHELDAAFFREVTNPKYMPTVQAKIVPSLLRAAIDVRFLSEGDVTDDDDNDDGVQENNDEESNAKNLLRRCRIITKSKWHDAVLHSIMNKKKRKHADISGDEGENNEANPANNKNDYASLPASIRATLLEEALIGAQQNVENNARSLQQMSKAREESEAKADRLKKRCIDFGAQAAQFKEKCTDFGAQVAQLEKAHTDSEEKVAQLRQALNDSNTDQHERPRRCRHGKENCIVDEEAAGVAMVLTMFFFSLCGMVTCCNAGIKFLFR